MQTIDLVKKIVEALEGKKAEDITVLDIGEVSSIADYFIIASGSNRNQVLAQKLQLLIQRTRQTDRCRCQEIAQIHRTAVILLIFYMKNR